MGFNYEQYKEELSNATGELVSLSSSDPYAYASGTSDDYNYATGTLCEFIIKKDKKAECEKVRDERKTEKRDAKSGNTESDKLLAQAAVLKAGQVDSSQMSPLAITGIIVGSLLAITVMVVVIKKVKK